MKFYLKKWEYLFIPLHFFSGYCIPILIIGGIFSIINNDARFISDNVVFWMPGDKKEILIQLAGFLFGIFNAYQGIKNLTARNFETYIFNLIKNKLNLNFEEILHIKNNQEKNLGIKIRDSSFKGFLLTLVRDKIYSLALKGIFWWAATVKLDFSTIESTGQVYNSLLEIERDV